MKVSELFDEIVTYDGGNEREEDKAVAVNHYFEVRVRTKHTPETPQKVWDMFWDKENEQLVLEVER